MKRKYVSLLVAAALLMTTLLGCGAASSAAPSASVPSTSTPTSSAPSGASTPAANGLKFAVMFGSGGLGDNGYNDEVFAGCEQASKQFNIPFDYCEPKTITDFETQLRMYSDAEEYAVIIAISTEQVDALKMVAADYPEQKFCMLDTKVEGLENVHSITASHPEQHFLSGMLAGLATTDTRFPKSNPENILGFACAMDNPVSRAQASGFLAGAKYVNPDVEIILNYIGSYADPGKAKELAMAMFDRGADVVSQNAGSSGLGVFAAAKEKDRYVIGTALAMVDPDHSLSTSRKKVELFVVQEIESIANGTWKAGVDVKGIADGVCDYDIQNLKTEVPADVVEKLEAAKKLIAEGKLIMPNDVSEIDAWSQSNQMPK